MAAMLVGVFVAPLGIFLAGRAEITLAYIGTTVWFLPLFVVPAVTNLECDQGG
jgi:hypothetical protein